MGIGYLVDPNLSIGAIVPDLLTNLLSATRLGGRGYLPGSLLWEARKERTRLEHTAQTLCLHPVGRKPSPAPSVKGYPGTCHISHQVTGPLHLWVTFDWASIYIVCLAKSLAGITTAISLERQARYRKLRDTSIPHPVMAE
jgi:hypothetical protein